MSMADTSAHHIVDTHRHPIGPKLRAKMAERGMFDPSAPLPQANAENVIFYREFIDLDYAMPKQRESGVTLSIGSNGGEIEWIAGSLLQLDTNDALKFLNDEYHDIGQAFPGEFVFMANAHALEEGCRPVVEDMVRNHCAKAIAISSSYGKGADRKFLDDPKADWLWEFAQANGLLVHIHPPMDAVASELLTQYRLNEAIGRPFDSTVTAAKMIYSGVFDRYPGLQVLVVHLGGDLASILGRLDFNWKLNYNGVSNPPADKVDKNNLAPSEYFKTNIWVDSMGFNPIGLGAAVQMCSVDRVVFGSDYGPVPYGLTEHIEIVKDVLPDADDQARVLWRNSNSIFRLGLA